MGADSTKRGIFFKHGRLFSEAKIFSMDVNPENLSESYVLFLLLKPLKCSEKNCDDAFTDFSCVTSYSQFLTRFLTIESNRKI